MIDRCRRDAKKRWAPRLNTHTHATKIKQNKTCAQALQAGWEARNEGSVRLTSPAPCCIILPAACCIANRCRMAAAAEEDDEGTAALGMDAEEVSACVACIGALFNCLSLTIIISYPGTIIYYLSCIIAAQTVAWLSLSASAGHLPMPPAACTFLLRSHV